jgi:ribosomal 30S subunit maturation factor RimM
MSTYKQILDLIETAVFHYQSKDVGEVINFIRANSSLRSLDEKEIERLINKVCTLYKENPEDNFIPNA